MASSSAPLQPFQPSALIRLAPLQLSEIPAHPDLPTKPSSLNLSVDKGNEDIEQPDLLPFISTLLIDGLAFLSKRTFDEKFKHQSTKKAEPSAADAEVLTHSIPISQLQSQVPWTPANSDGRRPSVHSTNGASQVKVKRTKPTALVPEHWFARRSIHANISSKSTSKPGNASWEEFIYGLRDNHSQHEEDFTPTLFDARKVVDWSGQVRKLDEEGSLSRTGFGDVSMAVFEMCHDVPAPLKPRCFGVIVVTASVLPGRDVGMWEDGDTEKFVAVTVPIQLGMGVKKAFYASWQNLKEGENGKRKREVVQGLYCAVETCTLRSKRGSTQEEEIDWIMATASDAKGILPMWAQKLALPGAVPKDVSYFMKWIKTVDDGVIDGTTGS